MKMNPEEGARAFWIAQADVKPIILEHAERRVESEQASLTSLHQRLSQVSALMIAGAAVSTTVTTSGAKVGTLTIALAAIASCCFAGGGVAALAGLFSGRSAFPGDLPSWWAARGEDVLSDLDRVGAQYWLAVHYEASIQSLGAASRRRVVFLNVALAFGCLAGGLTAAAGLSAVQASLQTPPPAGRPQMVSTQARDSPLSTPYLRACPNSPPAPRPPAGAPSPSSPIRTPARPR